MAKQHNTTKTKTGNNPTTSLQTRNSEQAAERLAATPFAFMRRFSEEMSNLFEDFGFGRGLLTPIASGTNLIPGLWSPQVEMFERDDDLVVRADLPGLTKDDVKVEIARDGITIEGERKNENEEQREGYYRSERIYGKFYRRLPVPEGIDPEEAQATFRNGVLEITMPAPKREEQKSRRLDIQGEGQQPQKARGKAA
jgi:HSP20 family protein